MYRMIYSIATDFPTIDLTFKSEEAMRKYAAAWLPAYATAKYYWDNNEYTPDWVD